MAEKTLSEALLLLSKVSTKTNERVNNLEKKIAKTASINSMDTDSLKNRKLRERERRQVLNRPELVTVVDFKKKAEQDLADAFGSKIQGLNDVIVKKEEDKRDNLLKDLLRFGLMGGGAALLGSILNSGEGLTGLFSGISKVVNKFLKGTKNVVKSIKNRIVNVKTRFSNFLNKLKNGFDDIVESFKNFNIKKLPGIRTLLDDILPKVKTKFGNLLDNIVDGVRNLINRITGVSTRVDNLSAKVPKLKPSIDATSRRTAAGEARGRALDKAKASTTSRVSRNNINRLRSAGDDRFKTLSKTIGGDDIPSTIKKPRNIPDTPPPSGRARGDAYRRTYRLSNEKGMLSQRIYDRLQGQDARRPRVPGLRLFDIDKDSTYDDFTRTQNEIDNLNDTQRRGLLRRFLSKFKPGSLPINDVLTITGKTMSKLPILSILLESVFAQADINKFKEEFHNGEYGDDIQQARNVLEEKIGKRFIEGLTGVVGGTLGSGIGMMLGGLFGPGGMILGALAGGAGGDIAARRIIPPFFNERYEKTGEWALDFLFGGPDLPENMSYDALVKRSKELDGDGMTNEEIFNERLKEMREILPDVNEEQGIVNLEAIERRSSNKDGKVEDGLITKGGKIVKFDNKDDLFALKEGGIFNKVFDKVLKKENDDIKNVLNVTKQSSDKQIELLSSMSKLLNEFLDKNNNSNSTNIATNTNVSNNFYTSNIHALRRQAY